MLAIAWEMGTRNHNPEIPIYNFVTHENNTLSYKELLDQNWDLAKKIPCLKAMWYYCYECVENPIKFKILHFFYHVLPAFFIDLVLILIGHPLRLQQVYRKVIRMSKIFEFFAFTKFSWKYDNVTVRILRNFFIFKNF